MEKSCATCRCRMHWGYSAAARNGGRCDYLGRTGRSRIKELEKLGKQAEPGDKVCALYEREDPRRGGQ